MTARKNKLYSIDQAPDVSDWGQPARYAEQKNPLYQGNALVEALPTPEEVEGFFDLLKFFPKFDPAYRLFSQADRIDMLENLTQLFQPLNEHFALYHCLMATIRSGYLGRSIFTLPRPRRAHRDPKENEQDQLAALARGFGFLGMSGMGKTRTIERILHLVDQLISHSEYQGQIIMRAQLVWLKLDCPDDSSTRSLCLSFFMTLDQLLDKNYYADYARNGNANELEMKMSMRFLCALLNVGVLVIDEIQRLNRAKSGGDKGLLEFFVSLSNMIGVPIVLIGGYEAFDLFTNDIRLIRRNSQQGTPIWERLKKDGASWNTLMKRLWQYQYVRQPVPLSPELNDAMYHVTQGVVEFMIINYKLAQKRAISDGTETITPDLIYSVAADEMRLTLQPLEHIRNFEQNELKLLRGLFSPIELKSSYVHQPQIPQVPLGTKTTNETAAETPTNTADGSPTATGKGQKQPKIDLNDPRIVPDEDDLRRNFVETDEDTLNTYNKLKDSGHIGDAAADLPPEPEV